MPKKTLKPEASKTRKHVVFYGDTLEAVTAKAVQDGQSFSIAVDRALRRDLGLER